MKNKIFDEDLSSVCEATFIPWDELKNTTIFLTGATGLIGTGIINSLQYANLKRKLNLKVVALVRNEDKARERFEAILGDGMLSFIQGSVEKLPPILGKIDYIIHGASQTASKEFVSHAVETIDTAITGTKNLLELAKEKKVKGFIYMSSMEMYGYPKKGHHVTEDEIGTFSPLNLRNSYPISKIMCENLCCAYAKEYSVPAKIIRLTQTFGPGVHYNDNRIFAYFGRCVKTHQDIVLKTAGETERCYLYTTDAVSAILTILLKGNNAEAYNAADENTYCSIAEMAEKVAEEAGIKVNYDIQPPAVNGFPDTLYMYLDTSKLKSLGWKPCGGGKTIEVMFDRMLEGLVMQI